MACLPQRQCLLHPTLLPSAPFRHICGFVSSLEVSVWKTRDAFWCFIKYLWETHTWKSSYLLNLSWSISLLRPKWNLWFQKHVISFPISFHFDCPSLWSFIVNGLVCCCHTLACKLRPLEKIKIQGNNTKATLSLPPEKSHICRLL